MQALEIAARNCEGRKPDEPLFRIVGARKTLAWINTRAGTTVKGHGLRATFASIAEELVSGAALKRMLNHASGSDVTLDHYVSKSETQLRAGWQTVADFIDAAAAQDPHPLQPVTGQPHRATAKSRRRAGLAAQSAGTAGENNADCQSQSLRAAVTARSRR